MFGRRRRSDPDPLAHVDPGGAPARFRPTVASAVATRRRYAELLGGLRDGAVKDRLTGIGAQLDAGVLAVWDTVQRSAELERILATLDPDRVTDEYKRAKRSDVEADHLAAYEERFRSVQRLLNTLDDTDRQLSLLDARLGGAVAKAAEVALAAGAGADDLDAELSGVVSDLGALRAGLDDLS